MERYQLAAGSVTGREHRLSGKANQDGFAIAEDHDRLAVAVTDGCSSGLHSEVGAKLGARLLSQLLLKYADRIERGPDILELVRLEALAIIEDLARAMGGRFSQTLNDYFLFTSLVALITPEIVLIASIGDGVISINDETTVQIGPFPGNAPPYLAYGLVETSIPDEQLHFYVHTFMPTHAIKTFFLGTDGVNDLRAAENMAVPGREELVGPLAQFWSEDRFYGNPDQVRRRLSVINAETRTAQHGLLPDDTTFVVGRVKEGGSQ